MIEGSGGEEEKGRGGRGRGEGKRNYDVYFCNIYIIGGNHITGDHNKAS